MWIGIKLRMVIRVYIWQRKASEKLIEKRDPKNVKRPLVLIYEVIFIAFVYIEASGQNKVKTHLLGTANCRLISFHEHHREHKGQEIACMMTLFIAQRADEVLIIRRPGLYLNTQQRPMSTLLKFLCA